MLDIVVADKESPVRMFTSPEKIDTGEEDDYGDPILADPDPVDLFMMIVEDRGEMARIDRVRAESGQILGYVRDEFQHLIKRDAKVWRPEEEVGGVPTRSWSIADFDVLDEQLDPATGVVRLFLNVNEVNK